MSNELPTDKVNIIPQNHPATSPGLVPTPSPGPLAPRKGAGRPTNAERAARARLGLSQPPAGAAAGSAAAGGGPAGAVLAPLWTAENSRPLGQVAFLIPALATGWEGWALTDKESAALAEPLAQTLNALIPAGGKYAAVTALVTTLGVIGAMKTKGYREWVAAQPKKPAPEAAK